VTDKETKSRPDGLFIGRDITSEELQTLAEILLQRSGFSLSLYKEAYIQRRIATRVRALGCQNIASYLTRLDQDEGELQALLAALTIHVSQFFRNPSVFQLLEQKVFPELLKKARSEKRPLQLWSVGCAGGEEPYSLAIILAGLGATAKEVRILGSDISRQVLEQARNGRYNAAALRDVTALRKDHWFRLDGDDYQVVDSLREWVEFGYHDVLAENEFPAADLILCRNVLIYFSRAEQEKILKRFAATLPYNGYLILGRAETMLGDSRTLFSPFCLTERIYRRS